MTERLAFQVCPTPLGDMIAAVSPKGLRLLLSPDAGLEDLYARAARSGRRVEITHEPNAAPDLQRQLDQYFTGRRRAFDVSLDLRGTPFQLAVWRAVRAVPYGKTCSYADIARAVGKPGAWRAVGAANAVCPVCLVVPCHRIIGADGSLKGYAGDARGRQQLLDLERSRRAG
jgi:O-6-methylguanine DNA methyltransferase